MHSSPHLPTELWGETFAALPRKTLLSLHATSHLFNEISRPLLFAEFDLHPFLVFEGTSSHFSARIDVDRFVERVEFWTGPAIAPFVRGCTFSALRRRHVNPVPIFTALFRRLPKLLNLKMLTCIEVKFDRAAVASLCTLSNLAHVQLTGCSLDEEVLGLLLRVQSFRCAQIGGIHTGDLRRWLDILDKDTLRDLNLPSVFSPSLFPQGTSSIFPNVQSLLLRIKEWSEICPMPNFPAVRHLQVTWCPAYRSDTVQPQPTLFGKLEIYDGPHEVLLFVDPVATPRCLSIMPCDPQLLLERLFTVRPVLRRVEQLVISLHFLQPDVLEDCLASFPVLRELRMKVYHAFDDMPTPDGDMHTRQTFYDSFTLRPPPPGTLEKLHIPWPAHASTPSNPLFTLGSARTAKDALYSVNTALKCIWLVAPEFEYLWIRATDKEFTRERESGSRRDQKRLGLVFPNLQDPFVLRYTGA
ncbi:hypothetical protein K438DRAFT_2062927 [Mycena galopus ATCC 62051]|nr:hypothetical protein K438DRAFT_2062927 [Mycena galopus ATCC 62051]